MKSSTFYGAIYKITNLINGKIYIGQSKEPYKRWISHKTKSKTDKTNRLLYNSMRKYSVENFAFQIIDHTKSQDELNKLEEYYILELNSLTPNGYNVVAYDNGMKILSNDTKIKISNSLINKKTERCSSNYLGVFYRTHSKTWIAYISFNTKQKQLGCFNSEKDAAMARDIYIINNGLQDKINLNFPELLNDYLNRKIIPVKNKVGQYKRHNSSSIYKGVSYDKQTKKWIAQLKYNNKNYNLGRFKNEIDAAKAYDIKVIELRGNKAVTNFEY